MNTTTERPMSEAAQLLLNRADELRREREPLPPLVTQGSLDSLLLSLRNRRKLAIKAKHEPRPRVAKPQPKAKQASPIDWDRSAKVAMLIANPFAATVKAIVTKPCCSQCGAEGPVSRNLKLCDECFQKRKRRQQKGRQVYRLVSTPRDYRQELQVYFETNLQQESCPVCGVGIDPELPACGRHLTIVLLKAMRASRAEA